VACLTTETRGGLAGGLGRAHVAHVVLDATDEQREPAREHEHLPVLGEGESGVQQPDEFRHPFLTLAAQIGRGHEGVLAAQPLDGDRKPVERGAVEVGPADALDELERAITGRVEQHRLGRANEPAGILRTAGNGKAN
jgi:hypothetical protein